MSAATNLGERSTAQGLALEFLSRVWGAEHELNAIDDLMTEDYVITSGGVPIRGREAFKTWVAEFQRKLIDARTQSIETFADASGEIVVSRWICIGKNNGIFGLPADGRPVSFTGIAIWRIRDHRLSECWVERSALELYRELTQPVATGEPA
jgi:ketosteroid isomerase-like protein